MIRTKDILFPKSCVKTGNPHLIPARWADCNRVVWDKEGAIKPIGGWTFALNVQDKIDDLTPKPTPTPTPSTLENQPSSLENNQETLCVKCGAKI